MDRTQVILYGWIAIALSVLAAAMVVRDFRAGRSLAGPEFKTPYQAVLLDNGMLYYGKISGLGTPFPKLSDVYYVQDRQDPQTKQMSHVLIKRGKELHAPTETYVDARHIIMIEPVGTGSQVANLIAHTASTQ